MCFHVIKSAWSHSSPTASQFWLSALGSKAGHSDFHSFAHAIYWPEAATLHSLLVLWFFTALCPPRSLPGYLGRPSWLLLHPWRFPFPGALALHCLLTCAALDSEVSLYVDSSQTVEWVGKYLTTGSLGKNTCACECIVYFINIEDVYYVIHK